MWPWAFNLTRRGQFKKLLCPEEGNEAGDVQGTHGINQI